MPKPKPKKPVTTAPKPPRVRNVYPFVSPEAFVTAWTNADTVDDVVKATGLPKGTVVSRANAYRKKEPPVNLKLMGRGAKKIDVAGLNALIAELSKAKK